MAGPPMHKGTAAAKTLTTDASRSFEYLPARDRLILLPAPAALASTVVNLPVQAFDGHETLVIRFVVAR